MRLRRYDVSTQQNAKGGFISLSKGGVFRTISGLKTSLNVTLTKELNGINVEAKVGIFGQQAMPTIISMFITWPVLITQVIGMIKQAKLDDEVIAMIEDAVKKAEASEAESGGFCHECGKPMEAGNDVCPSCGTKQ